jgi:hypothetical protein
VPSRLEALPHQLAGRPDRGPGEARGTTQELGEREPGLSALAAAIHGAHRRHRDRCITGEQVADRHAVVGQEPAAVGVSALDDRGVSWLVRHVDPTVRPIQPTEGRDAVDRPVQDAHLAGRCGGREHRSPLGHVMGPLTQPPRQGRQGARPHAPLQHRVGEPVGLHEDHTGDVRVGDGGTTTARSAQQRRGDGVVGSGGDQPDQQGRDQRDDPGGEERPSPRVEGLVRGDVEDRPDRDGLAAECQQHGADPAEPCGDRHEHHPEDDAADPHQQTADEQLGGAADLDARDQPGSDQQPDAGAHHGQKGGGEVTGAQTRPLGAARRRHRHHPPALGPCEHGTGAHQRSSPHPGEPGPLRPTCRATSPGGSWCRRRSCARPRRSRGRRCSPPPTSPGPCEVGTTCRS